MYTVIDFETTGLDFRKEQITEVGAVRLDEDFNEVGVFHTFVTLQPGKTLSEFTDITQEMVDTGVAEAQAVAQLASFIGKSTVVAQYAPFDLAFLHQRGFVPRQYICTKSLTSMAEPDESSSLGPTCERLGISLVNAHRALDDAKATGQVLKHRIVEDGLLGHENVLVVTEDRPIQFLPRFTKKIYTKSGALIADFKY